MTRHIRQKQEKIKPYASVRGPRREGGKFKNDGGGFVRREAGDGFF